jgi:hypothetical protein
MIRRRRHSAPRALVVVSKISCATSLTVASASTRQVSGSARELGLVPMAASMVAASAAGSARLVRELSTATTSVPVPCQPAALAESSNNRSFDFTAASSSHGSLI